MQFVKSADLKKGMRLARPIYNRNGVLLYERNSKLTEQGISSIRNFGLIGIFVLEPAEPVSPMTQDDIDFERFQTMNVYAIQEEMNYILERKRVAKMQVIAANIIRSYGHLEKKINFIQNLRSKEDRIYKHSLNVAILCAMIGHRMNIKVDEQLDTVIAAVVHDIGKRTLPKNIMDKDVLTEEDLAMERMCEISGHNLLENVFESNAGIKRICVQTRKALDDYQNHQPMQQKIVIGAKILLVAETYDTMTAMKMESEPSSEVKAIRYLMDNPELFEPRIVEALIQSIHILAPGTCIELNTGEKGLVITANPFNILRPVVLGFNNNKVMDLSNERAYKDIHIKDIMKTMDNRYIMDTSILRKNGIEVEEPEYVPYEEYEEYVPGMF